MVRIELTAEDSLAAIRARSKLGIAMAAIIRIIATTINSSMSENPFCFLFMYIPVLLDYEVEPTYLHRTARLLGLGQTATGRFLILPRLPCFWRFRQRTTHFHRLSLH